MSEDTLLAHLVGHLDRSSENIATEALAYILSNSAAADAFKAFAEQIRGGPLPDLAQFHTQQRDEVDGGIRDLVGYDGGRNQCVVVEAKFWAGLTPNQPVTYLEQLIGARRPALLLFVVPLRRIGHISTEVERRCLDEDMSLVREPSDPARMQVKNTEVVVAVTTWDRVLGCLSDALTNDLNPQKAAELRQLRGLIEREEQVSMQPFSEDFVRGDLARHLLDLLLLVPQVIDEMAMSEPLLVTDPGRRMDSGDGWWGRYFWLGHWKALLQINVYRWVNDAKTPLWLQVFPAEDVDPAAALASLEGPLGSYRDSTLVPIDVPVAEDRDLVVSRICDQVRVVHGLLSSYLTDACRESSDIAVLEGS